MLFIVFLISQRNDCIAISQSLSTTFAVLFGSSESNYNQHFNTVNCEVELLPAPSRQGQSF